MPQPGDIQRGLIGAWRLMMGRADGAKLLDVSADGFWDSFFAIALALPALGIGWIGIANEFGVEPGVSRISLLLRLATVDVGAWVLPLAALGLVARQAGIADRFVHYVVASNWGSAIVVWLMLPASLAQLAFGATEAVALLSLLLFLGSLVLSWRLTDAVLGKGPAVASGVFAGMFAVSLAVLFSLQALLGVAPAPQFVSG